MPAEHMLVRSKLAVSKSMAARSFINCYIVIVKLPLGECHEKKDCYHEVTVLPIYDLCAVDVSCRLYCVTIFMISMVVTISSLSKSLQLTESLQQLTD